MNTKTKILVLLLFTIAIIGIITPINATESTNIENKVFTKESKEKSVKLKLTWNANGGKIGTKKTKVTTIKKGSKISKLVANPKRSKYKFKGWYTKKTGGKKITKNTKPTKSITYYAKWTKTASNSKIVGSWRYDGLERSIQTGRFYTEIIDYYFFANGKFQCFDMSVNSPEKFEGKYSVSNGKVYLKNVKWYKLSDDHVERNIAKFGSDYRKWGWGLLRKSNNVMTTKYKFGSDGDGNYLEIAYPRVDPDLNYIYPGEKFYKA
jgi:uncharacterized repeat protein (TIGR02543 family)